jgi:hypothetical protein
VAAWLYSIAGFSAGLPDLLCRDSFSVCRSSSSTVRPKILRALEDSLFDIAEKGLGWGIISSGRASES